MTLERDIAYELQALEARIRKLEMRRRICVECKYHSFADYAVPKDRLSRGMDSSAKPTHLCSAVVNIITGESQGIWPCEWTRAEGAQCGLDGVLWEPKDAI